MKVLILGIDGYLGWPLALRLAKRGHEVIGIDNLYTRNAVKEVGSDSAFPLPDPEERVSFAKKILDVDITFYKADVKDFYKLHEIIQRHKPDAIVHFAEQRSAPYSMIDVDHANYTFINNLTSTINLIYSIIKVDPNVHILKMGTMGEYGTPNYDILERPFVEVEINGKKDKIPFPKWASSWYHWSKVYDSYNLLWANQVWGITITDIMQGPVYGTRTEEIIDDKLRTRFDFDEVWGTVVNRYCVEAVLGLPLTPYGKGGQTRGFISLEDSMQALTLLLENPPKQGEYRVVNQIHEVYSVMQIAQMVKEVGESLGMKINIQNVKNPRIEKEEHYYNVETNILPSLGFRPKKKMKDEIKFIIEDLIPFKSRLENFKRVVMPKTDWRKGRENK
ncbi:NAD-dependent dehydratase [Sulfolobus sp. A20]|uniref:UDP-sulfoquinovose synthase n=2 Tax=Sulfolobaceae TaxID=118883 RepID=UPI0008460D12|nr:UDP-sulfoquinovose synthase [Sulfolobus sp. A20]TRM75504.1 NAD-dependent dehydratase [Sulfolobus sp. E5]TRM78714.1 NAD-dependent dehydratase [Sulfolobus sp. A20-N-F8]TRM81688.1 NAD-dependent dehydratase [Sulfolobus sp. D5]TRM87327.1 NAD-dependent dehydratase [Sulfolobus sp. E3]TRM87899.1 NAD-dependent dehydratase [Sulfolobus sp. C3]